MTRANLLILLGLLVALAPFSGIPSTWLEWIVPLFGACIGGIGYSLRAPKEPAPSLPVSAT